MRRYALAGLPLLLASACTMGPNYTRPAIELPASHRGAEPATVPGDSLADREWSALFNDPALTDLVTSALKQNFDLRIAAERVLQARAVAGLARADRWPAVDASVQGAGAEASRAGASRAIPPDAKTSVSYAELGFSLGWELDVWGRLRRLNEAARAEYVATEEARRGVITTLVADTVETYLTLRALDAELEIARRTLDTANDSLRLTTVRYERGVGTALDVRQAEQLLFTASGQIASLERQVAQAENALSLLAGRAPGEVQRGLELSGLHEPTAIPAGLPSTLLERRPDIRRAEQELIAANARIGAARAEYFPRISLTGFFGTQSRALSDLLSSPARLWSASAGAAVPLFDAGRRRENVRLAESVQRELVVAYQRSVFTALREVADALAGCRRTSEELAEQSRLVEALRTSVRLSTQRYEGGVDTYLQVLDAQRNLFQGELDLTLLKRQELAAVVQLYRALGGGWNAQS